MNPEFIRAVGSLWLLALVILLIVFVIVFRKQLKSLMERLTNFTFKRGDIELSASQELAKPETELQPALAQEVTQAKDSANGEESSTLDSEPANVSTLFGDLAKALLVSRNLYEGAEAFKKLQESETDEHSRLSNEAIYLYWRFQAGDTAALDNLKELAKKSEISAIAQFWIGNAYSSTGEFDRASEAYEASATLGKSTDKANRVVLSAISLFDAGTKEEAYRRLMVELGNTTESESIYTIYKGLASLYEKANNAELKAIALDKALEFKPNDTIALFGAGHAYGQKTLEALALLHYSTLLRIDPKNAGALNNIAIVYQNLDLKIKSVDSFKLATELDNTLAAANLAHQYINAGFADEASTILGKAKKQEDVHSNVGGAMMALSARKDVETETQEKSLNKARERQRFLRTFAEAYFTENPQPPNFQGVWRDHNGIDITISQTDQEIEILWPEDQKRKYTGTINNLGIIIFTYTSTYNISSSSMNFVQDGNGYAELADNGKELNIMTLQNQEHTFVKLQKIS